MIKINNLNFSFKNKEPLFDELSIQLEQGSIVGLLGKNGSGKTTLLKMIAGLLVPKSGSILSDNKELRSDEASFLSNMYFVPEEFYLPPVSIKNHIKANSAFYPNFDKQLIEKLLKEFELEADSKINEMSYGQKKKYLISFALATKCRLTILDEPTNGLDIPSKTIFRKVMAGSLEEDQLILISTHQVKDVENLIDKVVILDHGQIMLHENLFDISAQLQFGQSVNLDDTMLYSETGPSGFNYIKRDTKGNTPLNLELLFNAVAKGTKLFENE